MYNFDGRVTPIAVTTTLLLFAVADARCGVDHLMKVL